MVLILALVIVAIVLGIIGAVAHGWVFLLVIAIILFVADMAYAGIRWSRRSGRHPTR
ncbi:hypothetical protein [Streptomyces sp. 1331.2]|uniref:hypothetical protein n=1 Tax=Streptomyces sp. 1331.2 TaxID=1938835 RepID=UPI000BC8C3C9|nr:hypothetical protein [Streptomyces sp. 1331.2]SOB81364.1 hypothetical protein SAMN06272789_1494 [Streptomyces sp. 1331.2]